MGCADAVSSADARPFLRGAVASGLAVGHSLRDGLDSRDGEAGRNDRYGRNPVVDGASVPVRFLPLPVVAWNCGERSEWPLRRPFTTAPTNSSRQPRKRPSASDCWACRRPAHVNSSRSPFASFRSAVSKPSVNQP